FWEKAVDLLGISLVPLASVAQNEPFFAVGPPLAVMLALTTGVIVGADRQRANQLLRVLAWPGAIYAIYGIPAFLLDSNHVLWHEKQAYRDALTGTFINRNTAAIYF